MNRKLLKSITSLVLIISMFISMFASCSAPQSTNSTNETSTSETEVKETVAENIENKSSSYRGTQRTLTTTLDKIEKYSIQDEKILGVGEVIDIENRVISYYLTSWEENWREEWKEKGKIELPFTTSNYTLQCNGLDMDSEGNTYIILTDSSENHIYFVTVNTSGEVVLNSDIARILSEDSYIEGMAVGKDGKVYLEDNENKIVYTLDQQGNLLDTYLVEEGRLWQLQKDNENNVYLITEKKNQLYLNTLVEGDELLFQSEEQGIAINKYMAVYEGINNTFFIPIPNGLICYNPTDGSTSQLVDWLVAGIDYYTIDYVGVMVEKEEQIITMIGENVSESPTANIYTFEEYDPSENKYIVLATLGLSSHLNKQIATYNRTNPEYPIRIKTYYGENEDALRQLNTDLLAGNVIDIIDMDSFDHITSLNYYAKQGLLEDIGAWLEKDETIDETDLLPSLLEANKIDGILYNLVPSFSVETFSGAQSTVGDDYVWTVEEAMSLLENNPECTFYSVQNKKDFVTDICRYNGAYLVDEKEGTCHFDSKEFIQLLTYANTLPDYDEEAWRVERGWEWDYIYHNQCFLYKTKLHHYTTSKHLFGQRLIAPDLFSFVGFPMIDESVTNGSIFVNLISISMVSTSQKKEYAWGFFQYLLSDFYQNDEAEEVIGTAPLSSLGFSATKSGIQHILTEKQNIAAGFGYDGKWQIRYDGLTQEDMDDIQQFMHSVHRLAWENETITNIVIEEAQYYFAGECSAEEAAQRMQSRVELYLMEKE